MNFVYASVKKEEVEEDKEYPVFMEWNERGKCTCHIFSTDDEAKNKKKEWLESLDWKSNNKCRTAKIMFIKKKEEQAVEVSSI